MKIHDLAAPYAMDALEQAEREQFEDHMKTCSDCRLEVTELQEVTSRLGAAEGSSPSSQLREAVLAGIGDIEQEAVGSAVIPLRPRRPSPWLAAAMIALIASIGALAFVTVQLRDRVDLADKMREIMAAPDAALASLEGDLSGQFYYSLAMDQAVLVSDLVPTVSSDQTYELWLIDGAGPVPAGLFRPSDGAVTLLVNSGVARASFIGVTIEPRAGSDSPTGDILATALIG